MPASKPQDWAPGILGFVFRDSSRIIKHISYPNTVWDCHLGSFSSWAPDVWIMIRIAYVDDIQYRSRCGFCAAKRPHKAMIDYRHKKYVAGQTVESACESRLSDHQRKSRKLMSGTDESFFFGVYVFSFSFESLLVLPFGDFLAEVRKFELKTASVYEAHT